MIQHNVTLSISIEWWSEYQDLLKQVVALLTTDQLAFRLGRQRSVGEIVQHMIMARAWYLHGVMGEGGQEIAARIEWDKPDASRRSSTELLSGIDQTWELLTACLRRWTADEMCDRFFINWLGHDASRGWVIWHVLEHEIHHGGELSFTLGSFGLPGLDV